MEVDLNHSALDFFSALHSDHNFVVVLVGVVVVVVVVVVVLV